MPEITVPYPVPYTCQYASPEQVREFVADPAALLTDPNWASYGAASPAEYAHWARRSCGVVCVKMAADALTGAPGAPVMDWVRAGLALDGYLTEPNPDHPDRRVERGWKHAALARLAANRGLQAHRAAHLALDDLAAHVRAGRLVIASVSAELGDDGPVTRHAGHLVLVYGVEHNGSEVTGVILHNPSGRTPALQAGARIPAGRFRSAFSGRGIVVGRGSEQNEEHVQPQP